MVIDLKPDFCGEGTVRLYFNKEVKGDSISDSAWNYYINGTWLGNGNNIVKVVHR